MLFLLAGRAVRSRSRLTAELHEAAVRADEAREAEAERAVADERRRIAREMHDVVAHSVSMMVVQAGGARRILERDPARAVAAAELIERTGREALAEMRALLGVLHAERARRVRAAADAARARRARRARAQRRRAGRARRRGRAARAARRARPRRLPRRPGGADERRQAPGGAPTEVSRALPCRRGGGADRGSRATAACGHALGGSGHGLVGMRERVRDVRRRAARRPRGAAAASRCTSGCRSRARRTRR